MRVADAWNVLIGRAKTQPQTSAVSPALGGPGSVAISSPWSTGALAPFVYSDIFTGGSRLVSRAEAMTIPPVAKARQIILGQIASLPLRAYRGTDLVAPQPTFLYRTDLIVSPWHRMAWTLDDLIFYGWSLWVIKRGTVGQILHAERCPFSRWMVKDGVIYIDGKPVDQETVILIPGPGEGLLDMASRTIRGAAQLENSWVARAQNPIPALNLQDTDPDAQMDADDVKDLIQSWVDARSDVNGAVSYSPGRIKPEVLGQLEPTLFTEGRNFIKLDVANFTGLPAALLDGSLSTASLTYSTREGQRNELADLTLGYWMSPIEQRLSLDDVVPAGQRVRFDEAEIRTTTPSPTGPVTED